MAWCSTTLLKRLSASSIVHRTDTIILQVRSLSTSMNNSVLNDLSIHVHPFCAERKSTRNLLRAKIHRPCISSLPIIPYSTSANDGKVEGHASYDILAVRSILEKYNRGSVDLIQDQSSGIAVITLNNPEKRNAVSGKMMLELADIVKEMEHWSQGKGLILRGERGFFCAGAELGMVRDSLNDRNIALLMTALMHDVTTRLLALPVISVALIEGGALGGGAELTTCCDFRLVTESSKIGFLHLSLGVIPGWGGGTRLAKILGHRKALDVLCSSRVLTSQSALQIGLVDDIISDGQDTLQNAKEWVSQYTRWEVQALQAAKQVIHMAGNSSPSQSLVNERTCFSRIWGNPAHSRAINSIQKS